MKGSLGVHKTLELALWVVVLNVLFVLLLLLSSLLISFSNGGIHLSLHLSSLLSSFSDGQFGIVQFNGVDGSEESGDNKEVVFHFVFYIYY